MAWLLQPQTKNALWSWRAEMFTNDQLDQIVELGKSLTAESGRALGNDSIRKSNVAWVESNNDTAWIYQTLSWNVQTINNDKFGFDLTHIEPLQFTVYDSQVQGFYGQHIDLGINEGGFRKLSFVLQLSDPADYEGGELKLYYSRDATVMPKGRGVLLFFPSWALHEVTPVTQGIRHSLVGWVAGPKFK